MYEEIELLDCPICNGAAIVEEENGWCCYISCMDCGAHTAEVQFQSNSEEDKIAAAKKAATMWNMGKVLSHDPGE